MDLGTVTDVVRVPSGEPASQWRPGDAWLAGGTWLFSEPQPNVHRLIDITALDWEPLTVTGDGLQIAATCTIRDLYALERPAEWNAGWLIPRCCDSFLSSFKIWHAATVGGNICMSLPAGPMISLSVALEGTYTICAPDGSRRTIDAIDFTTGNNANMLREGEILRQIDLPLSALRRRAAFRRMSLIQHGRSTALLIGTLDEVNGGFSLTVTAATPRPVRLTFATMPAADDVTDALDGAVDEYFDDPNGSPAHRRHLTHRFAREIRAELAGQQ
jgi:CO/xanthine dehydrogenase FAD-binding subunit